MAAPCKTCEKYHEKSSGTAPVRQTPFNTRTCYLHMDRFSDYKYNKEMAKKIREKTVRLLNLNENFTNLEVDIDKLVEILQTEDIVSLKQKFRNGELNLNNINSTDSMNREATKLKETKNFSSRSPIMCPLSGCNQLIGATSVLTHFLLEHRKKFHALNYQEIKTDQTSKIEFSEKLINFNDIVSLGILLYGGSGENNKNYPGQLGICRTNSFLPDRYQHFIYHVPIIVMASKTCMSALLGNKDLREKFYDEEDISKQILILWLITVETSKPLYASITVYDKEGTSSRSTIVKLRSVKDIQNPNEFLACDVNYLLLSRGELNLLSNFGTGNIYLEIFVHEFDF